MYNTFIIVLGVYQLLLFRWIQDTRSYLYEPAICRMIHKLMKKLFMQLIGEFKRLGATIVYADFNRIVICTKKRRYLTLRHCVHVYVNSICYLILFCVRAVTCGYVEFILNSIMYNNVHVHVYDVNCVYNYMYVISCFVLGLMMPVAMLSLYSIVSNQENCFIVCTLNPSIVGICSNGWIR